MFSAPLCIRIAGLIFASIICSILLLGYSAEAATLAKPTNKLGLVGYWSFNEGTGSIATDFSGNGNHGAINGAAWASGKFGAALDLDGDTNFVSIPNTSTLKPASFTISAWVKRQGSQEQYAEIIQTGNTSPYCEPYCLEFAASNQIDFVVGSSAGQAIIDTGAIINDETWYHIVGTHDNASGNMRLYVNGVQVDSGTRGGTVDVSSASDVYFGRYGGGGQHYGGLVDEIRIYNRALSAPEVAALYGAGQVKFTTSSVELARGTTLANGLVGHWTFDGPDVTTTIADRSGSGNNGYFIGSATSSAKTIGKLGQGLSFNGSSNYVRRATFSNQPTSAMTLCAWIRTSYTGGDQVLMNINRNPSNIANEGVFKIIGGKLRFWDYNGTSLGFAEASPDSNTTVTDGAWHHTCFTKNGTAGTFYLDGAADGTKTAALNVSYGSADWVIGYDYRDGNKHFNGTMDDVRVYNRALSAAEVKQLASLGIARIVPSPEQEPGPLEPPATEDMIAWYRGDSLQGSGTATAWNDKTANGRHMTAYNSPAITTNGLGTRTVASLTRGTGSNGKYFRWSTSVAQSQPFTIVAIAKGTPSSGTAPVAAGATSIALGTNVWEHNNTFFVYANSWDAWESSTDILDNAWHVLQGDFNQSSTQGFLDGTLVGALSGPDFDNQGLTDLAIGSTDMEGQTFGHISQTWHGDIAEVIFYNRLLTSGERAELDAYVADYYGL